MGRELGMRHYKPKRLTLMPAVALAALAAIVAIPAMSTSNLYAASPEHFAVVTVHSGDTLWQIASSHTNRDGNVQDTVDSILTANHMSDAVIQPGQHLRIPR
jgi:nucleoid-associated protein YgaU